MEQYTEETIYYYNLLDDIDISTYVEDDTDASAYAQNNTISNQTKNDILKHIGESGNNVVFGSSKNPSPKSSVTDTVKKTIEVINKHKAIKYIKEHKLAVKLFIRASTLCWNVANNKKISMRKSDHKLAEEVWEEMKNICQKIVRKNQFNWQETIKEKYIDIKYVED